MSDVPEGWKIEDSGRIDGEHVAELVHHGAVWAVRRIVDDGGDYWTFCGTDEDAARRLYASALEGW